MAPFELDNELVETAIRLEGVSLPTSDLLKLVRKSFTFPLNPEPGYIDGSVYIEHAHHPVDVTSILFGDVVGDFIEAEFKTIFVFEFEGLADYKNTRCTLLAGLNRPIP